MEPLVRRILGNYGVEIKMRSRAVDVVKLGKRLEAVMLDNGDVIHGHVFVDCTGSAGPMGNCLKYGNGCSMCILRCPSFGGRVSITARCGVTEFIGRKGDQVGAMSGSCEIYKESLSRGLVETLERAGVAIVPLPPALRSADKLAIKACQQRQPFHGFC